MLTMVLRPVIFALSDDDGVALVDIVFVNDVRTTSGQHFEIVVAKIGFSIHILENMGRENVHGL